MFVIKIKDWFENILLVLTLIPHEFCQISSTLPTFVYKEKQFFQKFS